MITKKQIIAELNKTGIEVKDGKVKKSDLKRIIATEDGEDEIKLNGKMYSLHEPETWPKKINGNLDLWRTKITSLPDNLQVGGYLNLRGTKIISLPDNLKVGGDLYLEASNITSLPDNLQVGGALDLRDTKITSLPDNLKVGGNLVATGNQYITSLPNNLKVGGDLYLRETKITSLPDNLQVGRHLDLVASNITSLPDNLKVGRDLYLRGTKITSLPDNLQVGEDLVLTGTNITSLPDNLKVGGDLYLDGTPITSLPESLKVGGAIFISKDSPLNKEAYPKFKFISAMVSSKKQVIAELSKMGIEVKNGMVKKSDIAAALSTATAAHAGDDEFECEECHGIFDIEDSVKDHKKGKMLCENCAKLTGQAATAADSKVKTKVSFVLEWDAPNMHSGAVTMDTKDMLSLTLNKLLNIIGLEKSKINLTKKQSEGLSKLIESAGQNTADALAKIKKEMGEILSALDAQKKA